MSWLGQFCFDHAVLAHVCVVDDNAPLCERWAPTDQNSWIHDSARNHSTKTFVSPNTYNTTIRTTHAIPKIHTMHAMHTIHTTLAIHNIHTTHTIHTIRTIHALHTIHTLHAIHAIGAIHTTPIHTIHTTHATYFALLIIGAPWYDARPTRYGASMTRYDASMMQV